MPISSSTPSLGEEARWKQPQTPRSAGVLTDLDGERLGPAGDGCYVTSKTGECLFGEGEGFAGCDIDDDSSCDATCEELTNRLKVDAALEVDSELLYSECIDNRCWAVGRIEDECYTNDFFGILSVAHAHDCSLGGKTILEEHLAEQGPDSRPWTMMCSMFVRYFAGVHVCLLGSALGLAGCGDGCTERGCVSGVTFALELQNTGDQRIEVCRDASCLEVSIPPSGCSRTDGDWTLEVCADASLEGFQVQAMLTGDPISRDQTFTLTLLRGEESAVVFHDNVELTPFTPNGDDCPPTCWHASRTVTVGD